MKMQGEDEKRRYPVKHVQTVVIAVDCSPKVWQSRPSYGLDYVCSTPLRPGLSRM